MSSAKDLHVAPISSADARAGVKTWHYSGKVVNNSQLHFGVFWEGKLEGVMQFGPPMSKKGLLSLVKDTAWNGFLELNRMAFSDKLPRNSESRALAVALRMIRKNYPHIEWVLSFSDATQCGDGAIYRASGFQLCGAKRNVSLQRLPSGEVVSSMSLRLPRFLGTDGRKQKLPPLPGFQFKYIYFLNPAAKDRLTVPLLPFSTIDELNGRMYKGVKG